MTARDSSDQTPFSSAKVTTLSCRTGNRRSVDNVKRKSELENGSENGSEESCGKQDQARHSMLSITCAASVHKVGLSTWAVLNPTSSCTVSVPQATKLVHAPTVLLL
jgi:hypothetical protein